VADPVLTVRVDWGSDGAFTGAYDDVSSALLDSVSWTRGRSADFSAEATGSATFVLSNHDDRFTPDRNWHDNPSFEAGTAGWSVAPISGLHSGATSIAQVTDNATAATGTKAGELVLPATAPTFQSDAFQGDTFQSDATPTPGTAYPIPYPFRSGVVYSVSVYLKSMSGALTVRAGLASSGTPADIASSAADITAAWAAYAFTWTPSADRTDAVFFVRTTTTAAATVRIDGVQVNPGAAANTYIEAPTRGQLVPGRPVHIYATHSATDYAAFFGYIQRLAPDPRDPRSVTITTYDVLQRMSETEIILPSVSLTSRSARDFRVAALDEFERGSRNLLPNPSFETDVTGWDAVNGTLVRSTAGYAPVGGSAACATLTRTSGTATAAALARMAPYVLAGQLVNFSIYLRAASPQSAVIGIGEDAGLSVYRSRTVSVTTSWQRFSVTYTAPTTRLANSAQMLRGYVGITSGAVLLDCAMLIYGGPTIAYADAGAGRWPSLVANGHFDGLDGWSDCWTNMCANGSLETDATGWSGATRESTAPMFGAWHGSGANMASVSFAFTGKTFKQGRTYDLRVSMRTATGSGSIGVTLGSSGTPADTASSALTGIGTTYGVYTVAWTPSADRTDVVFGTVNYPSAGYIDGLMVVRRDSALSAGPDYYADTGVGGGGSFTTSVTVEAPAKFGALAQSFVTPATAGAGRLYDFSHDGAVFLSGKSYTASIWAYSSSSMPYKIGIGANKGDGTFDEASATGTLSATTWTEITVTWTPSADRLYSTNRLSYMLYFQQTDATSRTVRIDGVRVIPEGTADAFEMAQWSMDATEADSYTQASMSGSALSVLSSLNALTLTRHWIESTMATPWYSYVTAARGSLATKTSAETYDDDLVDMTSAEIDRASIINVVPVTYGGGTEYYSDATSIATYGQRPATAINGASLFSNTLVIPDAVGPALVARYKDPRARPAITVVDRFPSQLQRELDDLVTVNCARLGIAGGKYLVVSLTTSVTAGGRGWTTVYQLEEAP